MGVYLANVSLLIEADSAEQALTTVREATESICLDANLDIPSPAIPDIEDAIVNEQYIQGAAFQNLVIFSPSENKLFGSHCYYSGTYGWARLEHAVRYTSKQADSHKLPDSIGHDARWIIDPVALEALDR